MTPETDPTRLPPMSRGMAGFAIAAFFLLGIAVAWLVFANPLGLGFLPGNGAAPPDHDPADHAAGVVYQCPMHPEVVQDTPGDCPICGMDLVATSGADPEPAEREVLYWYAPMDPTYTRDEPGLSPMGMKLVPKYADENTASDDGVVRIDPVQVQNIGVVSAEAVAGELARATRIVGILDFNNDRTTWINTKFDGWVENVRVSYVGQQVRAGDPLFDIYSPDLVTTQEEYLRALEYRDALRDSGRPETLRQAEALVRSSLERMRNWDIDDDQIEALAGRREVRRLLTVSAPVDGVIAEIMSEALEGMYVRPGMNLYRIADLSTVWVHADVHEQDMAWVREGLPAAVSFRNDAGSRFRGRVLYLYPEVSRETRTLKVCVEVPNPGGRLRPGMFADVIIEGPPVRDAVIVPDSAVIRSGTRNLVFLDLGDGRFRPREVELGIRGGEDRIQVVRGVEPGDRVVTQAQFLIDSESRIQEAIAKFRDRGAS